MKMVVRKDDGGFDGYISAIMDVLRVAREGGCE